MFVYAVGCQAQPPCQQFAGKKHHFSDLVFRHQVYHFVGSVVGYSRCNTTRLHFLPKKHFEKVVQAYWDEYFPYIISKYPRYHIITNKPLAAYIASNTLSSYSMIRAFKWRYCKCRWCFCALYWYQCQQWNTYCLKGKQRSYIPFPLLNMEREKSPLSSHSSFFCCSQLCLPLWGDIECLLITFCKECVRISGNCWHGLGPLLGPVFSSSLHYLFDPWPGYLWIGNVYVQDSDFLLMF